MNFNITKKDLKDFPFQLINEGDLNFIDSLPLHTSWLLPQTLAYLGTQEIVDNSTVETAKAFIASCSLGSDWAKGLIKFLLLAPRGKVLPKGISATKPGSLEYSALVPLFLAAFKKYQDIKYSSWKAVQSVTDPDLYAAMTCEVPEWTKDELLEFRRIGTTARVGKNAGVMKNPEKATSVNRTGVQGFDDLPRLAKVMLAQIWIAHPVFRHEYMILDPSNWDNMPEPLISTEVFKPIEKPIENKLPWE